MIENSKLYAQVDGFLNAMNEEYRSKVPQKLRNFFINNKNQNYNFRYDLKQDLFKQNLSKEAISIIALLHLNYWCETKQEQTELMNLFNNNDLKEQEEKRQKYNSDNLFKNNRSENYSESLGEENNSNLLPIEVKEGNLLCKIIKYVNKLLSHLLTK